MKNQPGFVLLELLLAILVLVVIGAIVTKVIIHTPTQKAAGVIPQKHMASTTPSSSPVSSTQAPAAVGASATAALAAHNIVTPPAATTPLASSDEPVATELYKISADGNSAQETPVATTLTASGNIKLVIHLSCAAACQFRLASDAYPLASSALYTSSQTITYSLTQHGTWYFYNQYTPNTRFGIKF